MNTSGPGALYPGFEPLHAERAAIGDGEDRPSGKQRKQAQAQGRRAGHGFVPQLRRLMA